MLKVEIDNLKMKLENKEKNLISANDKFLQVLNINDLKTKLLSEICVMHENKVSEEPLFEKIINSKRRKRKKMLFFFVLK